MLGDILCKFHSDHRKILVVDTQKIMIKKSEHTATESHQLKKGRQQKKKKGTDGKHKNSQKTINKMTVRAQLSIITLNANGLNSLIQRHRVKKKRHRVDK